MNMKVIRLIRKSSENDLKVLLMAMAEGFKELSQIKRTEDLLRVINTDIEAYKEKGLIKQEEVKLLTSDEYKQGIVDTAKAAIEVIEEFLSKRNKQGE
jgi:lipid A disaccharide synthetase